MKHTQVIPTLCFKQSHACVLYSDNNDVEQTMTAIRAPSVPCTRTCPTPKPYKLNPKPCNRKPLRAEPSAKHIEAYS